MRTFLTEYTGEDGSRWCGPDIKAISYDEAHLKAQRYGIDDLDVVGELVCEIDESTGSITVNPMLN